MTLAINEVLPRVHYVATALQTHFVVPFEFMANSYLKVYVNGVLKTYADPPLNVNQYSTTGVGVSGGGAIDFGGAGLALNDEVVIYGDIPIERLSDYPTTGKFPITALNEELDKMTSMILEARMQIDRALRLSDQDFAVDIDPIGEDRADRILGFDADGQPYLYTTDELYGELDELVAQAAASAAAAQSSEDDAETAQAAAEAAYNATVAAINALGAVLSYKGAWDASTGVFPGGGAAYAGWQYSVSVAGTVNGVVFTVGDRLTALVNNASTTTYAANWLKSEDSEFGLEIAAATTDDAIVDADLLGYSDTSAGGLGKKTAWSNIKTVLWAAFGVGVNALTAKSSLVDNDLLGIADSAASNASKKTSFANVYTWIQVKLNTTAKTTPVAADRVYIGDSAASNAQKYSTLTQVMTAFGSLINGSTAKTAPVAADEMVIADSAASSATKKVTFTNFMTLFGALISGSTAKSTPIAADLIAIADSAASNATKKVQVSELKTVVNTDMVSTGTIRDDTFVITDAAAYVINPADGAIQRWTLTASRTPGAAHANWQDGMTVTLLIADGTAYTITWTTLGVVWKSGTAPTLATTGYSEISITRENGVLRGVHVGDFAS